MPSEIISRKETLVRSRGGFGLFSKISRQRVFFRYSFSLKKLRVFKKYQPMPGEEGFVLQKQDDLHVFVEKVQVCVDDFKHLLRKLSEK